jgi:hypothetical protein
MPSTANDRLGGWTTSVAVKAPCRVATVSNITLSGEQTVNGVAVVEDDRVLVMAQTNTVDNGIYVVSDSAWSRSKDFDGARDAVQGTIVLVRPAAAGTLFYELTTANPVVIGTSNITFEAADPGVENVYTLFADTTEVDNGDALLGTKSTFTGAVARTQHQVNEWDVDLFKCMTEAEEADYRAQTKLLDHTSAFNIGIAAVAAVGGRAKLKMGAGILRLTANVNSTNAITIEGVGHAGEGTTGDNTANNGTMIMFDHTGFGFTVTNSGFNLRNLAMFRPQTAPGVGWTPYASNYDLNISGTDVTVKDVLFWGTAKGIILNSGGRLTLDNVKGQFFNNGLTVVVATDSVNVRHIHMWPFWSQNANVESYMKANFVASEYRRCDGLQVSDFFAIWHVKCIRFVHDAAGDTTNAQFTNIYSDDGGLGVITESGTNGVTAKFTNFNHQGTVANSCGAQANGTNAILDFIGFTSTASLISAIRNEDGTGNRIRVVAPYFTAWNGSGGAFTGMSCAGSGNELEIIGKAAIGTAASGATAAFGGANQKQGLWARGSKAGTTAADGRISGAHGLGYTPGAAIATIVGALPYTVNVESIDGTNINFFVTNGGVALASTAVNINWMAYY